MTSLVSPAHDVAPLPTGSPFQRRRQHAKRLGVDAVLIVIGVVSLIQVVGDTATMLTPICLLLAPAILLVRPVAGQWVPLVLAVSGFAAFLIASDINDTGVFNVKVLHWASFAVYYTGFLVLAGKDLERAFSILCGIAVGTMAYYVLPGGPYSSFTAFADWWKYAWGPWAAIVLLYLLIQLRVRVPYQALAVIGLAGFSFVENYRSHAMVCIASGTLLFFGWVGAGRLARWVQIAVFVVIAAASATVLPAIALSGVAGEAIRKKTELQESSGVPALLAGRTESPLSLTAIGERPLFGWGTANNISPEVFEKANALADRLGFQPDFPIQASWYLPNGDVSLHSVLLSGWVEGGVVAALLPLGLLIAAFMMVWNAPRYGRWTALVLQISIQAIWDLLFSPFSYNLLPAFAILALVFTARHMPARLPPNIGARHGV